jgi:hypothetical protein
MDGSEDPPVYVDFDSQFKRWTKCAPTFSEHLYAWMWDFALVLNSQSVVQAQNQKLSPEAIAFLLDNFAAGPKTYGWPGHTQFRFSNGDKRILIWASENQADCWLKAGNEESLRELLLAIWECDRVGTSMWSNTEDLDSWLKSNKAEGGRR